MFPQKRFTANTPAQESSDKHLKEKAAGTRIEVGSEGPRKAENQER